MELKNTKQLEKIKEFAIEHNIPILRPKTAELLISYIIKNKPKQILEIGTAIGYSGTLILENSCNNAVLDTIEKAEKSANLAKENFNKLGYANKVNVILGDAKEVLKNLTGQYDFIFLDGPKGQYINYLPDLLRLLKYGGTLFCDNVLFMGLVFSGKQIPHKHRTIVNNLQKFLNEISTNIALKTQIIDLEDGVSISIKEEK